jgi:hypothetical protein
MLGRYGAGARGAGRPPRAPWLPQLALLLAIAGAVFLVAARSGAFERRGGGDDAAAAALARGDLADDYVDDGAEGEADDHAAAPAALSSASSVRRCPSQKTRVVYRERRPAKCPSCPSPDAGAVEGAAAAVAAAPCEPPPAPLPREPSVDEALAILRRALTERGAGGGAAAVHGGDSSGGGSALASRIASSFAAYADLHARIMDPQDTSVPKRFVAWRLQDYGGAGLGNRLLGMVSTLAVAVATNRAFLMYADDVLSSVLAPAPREAGGIDWDWDRGMAAYAAAHGGSAPPREHHQQGLGMKEFCACEDWRSGSGVKDAVPLLTLESTQYFFPCVSHNPAYRPALRAMLGDSFEFFRHAMTHFIHLRPELRAELDAFEHGIMRPPPPAPVPGAPPNRRRYVIGLQIRTGHLIRARHEEQAFYKCARAVAAKAAALHAAAASASSGSDAAPAARGGTVDDALAAIEAALAGGGAAAAAPAAAAAAADGGGGDLDVVYFLATDDGELRSRARQVFGDALLLYGGPHNAAVMDTFLLSRCDDVIITWPKSTFGSVGAALTRSGKPPHAVVSGAKRGNECVQLLSTEPCFHGWFDRWKVSCYSKERFETPEALNYDNCYYCQADTDR